MTVLVRTSFRDKITGEKYEPKTRLIVRRDRGEDWRLSGLVEKISDDDILPCGTWLFDAYNCSAKPQDEPKPQRGRKPKDATDE